MIAEPATHLRTFLVFTIAGDQCGDCVNGHEIDTEDPTLFRIVRIEADGTRRVVAAFSRSHVAGTSEGMAAMERYPWPGNVRELRGAVERAVVMATGAKITLRDLPPAVRDGSATVQTGVSGIKLPRSAEGGHLNLQDTEQRMIVRALEETGSNITKAAKKLGLSRRTLHRRLKEMRASGELPPVSNDEK